jgi:hypothetical protein
MSLNTKFQSRFDPSRENVGKIARDAVMRHDGTPIEVGEMKGAILPDLVNDINENLMKDPYNGKPFYLLITEHKDLQMKNAMFRRPFIKPYRPWPEDNTMVFWKDPKTQELRFCWDIPHWSEIDNILQNPFLWDENLVKDAIAWKTFDMGHFGFFYHKEYKWIPNPKHQDRRIESKPVALSSDCSSAS